MKAKLYLFTAFTLITLLVSAQKYNVAIIEDWTDNAWVNTSRSTNTYDSNGNLLKMTTDLWTDGAWQSSTMITDMLNADGTVNETLVQTWQDNSWLDVSKTIYTYSATKNVLTETNQISMGPGLGFMDFTKLTYTYNEQDQLITQVGQMFNLLTNGWTNTNQNIYSYNADGTENQLVTQVWNLSNEWENSTRNTSTYNEAKQVIADLNERWENNAWVNDYKTSYTYSGSLIQESISQDWVDNAWIDTFKDIYTYNDKNEVTQILSQEWNTTLSQWENNIRITYSYDATGFHNIESTDRSLNVFPNPFTGQLTIESKIKGEHGIEVFNAVGQLVYSIKTTENSLKLDLGALQKGVYLIKTPQSHQSIKVVKTR